MKVSVIIGAYNVAPYLKNKMLSCIINQTYKNLEIILVNDGSTDSTATLCDDLEKQDSRIRVIHKDNGGLGSARNTGLDLATGEYVWFYDVDDEVDLQLIEKNIEIVKKYKVELIVFGINVITEATNEREKICHPAKLIESNHELKSIYMDVFVYSRHGNGFNCNKFYSLKFINACKIRFGNQRIQQDEVFNIKLYPYLQRVYIMPEALYDYNIVISGNTRSRYIEERLDIFLDIHQKMRNFAKNWLNNKNDYVDVIDFRLYSGLVNAFEFNLNHADCPLSSSQKLNYMRIALKNNTVNKVINSVVLTRNNNGVYASLVHHLFKKEHVNLLQLLFKAKKVLTHFRH